MSLYETDDQESTTDLDSHADTCVVGKNALIILDFETPVRVTGYDKLKAKSYRTVSAALAYDDPKMGEVHILEVHQAIEIPHLHHNLLCLMQLRVNDVEVNERPKFLTRYPTDSSHVIIIPSEGCDVRLTIPLSLKGVTSYFPTRKPTREEYKRASTRFELTSEVPEWNPHTNLFSDQEEALVDDSGMLLDYAQPERERTLLPIMTYKQEISEEITLAKYDLASALEAHVSFSNVMQVSKRNHEEQDAYYEERTPGRGLIICEINSETKPRLDAQLLARKWGIGLDAAKRTIHATTLRGIRSVLDPTISRRYPTNDQPLRYRRLPLKMYSDTMKASIRSRNGNKYTQVYCMRSGWTLAIPMQSKSDAHETLSLLFSRHGIPNILIVDGAKEQVQREI